MGDDNSTAKADCGGHHQGVDSHVAASAGFGQEMAGVTSDSGARGHNSQESLSQYPVNLLVKSSTAVKLDQDG